MADRPAPAYIRSQLLANHGIIGIFSLRKGGVSPPPFDSQNFGTGLGDADSNITQNMHRLIESVARLSMPHQAIQVHESGLLWCRGKGKTHQQQADILMTDQPDTAVCVRVADCLPILLAEPESGIVAAVHAGWRGTAAGIVKHAIQSMLEHGAKSKKMLASLGPCIGSCCFAIGKDTADALTSSAAGAAAFIDHASGTHADLAEINRLQLLEAGLGESHIELNRACTACEHERFFSFRRDGKRAGRQLAVVAIPSST
jgi:YfiH family protein